MLKLLWCVLLTLGLATVIADENECKAQQKNVVQCILQKQRERSQQMDEKPAEQEKAIRKNLMDCFKKAACEGPDFEKNGGMFQDPETNDLTQGLVKLIDGYKSEQRTCLQKYMGRMVFSHAAKCFDITDVKTVANAVKAMKWMHEKRMIERKIIVELKAKECMTANPSAVRMLRSCISRNSKPMIDEEAVCANYAFCVEREAMTEMCAEDYREKLMQMKTCLTNITGTGLSMLVKQLSKSVKRGEMKEQMEKCTKAMGGEFDQVKMEKLNEFINKIISDLTQKAGKPKATSTTVHAAMAGLKAIQEGFFTHLELLNVRCD